jgi:hypothetical protein
MDMYSKKKKLRYCECSREMHHLTLPEKRKYTISSRNPRSVMPTMMEFRKKLRKVFCFDNVTTLSVPLMDWWTATFPQTVRLLPVHIIPTHADHLIDIWMKTWYCKEKKNILPLIGEFGRTDLLQTHRFQAWYPETECAVRIALGVTSNGHDSHHYCSNWVPDDSNVPSHLENERIVFAAFGRLSHQQPYRAMELCIATRAYIRGVFLAVENGHESTARMILDLFEGKFGRGVFEQHMYRVDCVNKRISEKVAAWIRKHQPTWDQQQHLIEGVDANPEKKKQKQSDSRRR